MSRYQQGSEPIPSYKIVEFIGEGSYGSVYKARGPGGVDTALKFISLDNKQGLKEFKSVSLVKKLRHANLVPIFAIWLRDSNGNLMDESSGADSNSINLMGDKELVIAMGLGDISLAQALEESPKGIPPAKLIRYMEDAAKGIDYLNQPTHEPNNSSIIHCDIKPGNLLIVGGSVQVCDYGVAKALSNKVNLKKTMGAGTPAYAAPELINNDPSPQTDQYSLAISYVELRTGFLPFDETKALVSNLTGKLDFTKLPREEQEVMRRATSMQPGKRFESCMEMIEELKIASGLSRTGAVPVSATQRPVPGRASTNFEFEPHRFIDDVLQKGEMLVPDHRLVRRIGEGGYGQVWEARDQDDAVCALKVVRRSGNRGQQEYEILKKVKQINHKHLLETQAIWLLAENTKLVPGNMVGKPGQPNVAAIVIKTKLADKNLLQHMHDCKQQGHESIPVPELLRYMHQAASAIDELNDQDIQHRDIKPENILLLRDDAYVSDFGLAKMIDDDSAQSSASGMTFDYAAPELLEEKRVTKWTDQYSLALTYIMLRTGKLPYPAQASQSQKMRARTSNDYDFSGLTPVEREILAQALDREPSHRFPSCVAMMTRLSRAMGLGSGPLTSASGNLRFKDPLAGGTAPPIPSTRNIGSSTKHKPLSSDLAVAQVEARDSGSEDRAPGNFRNKTIGFGNTDTGPMGPPNSEPSKSNVQWRSESPRAAGFTDLPPRRMPILSIIASFAVLVTLGIGAWALDLFSSNGSSSVASTSKTSAVTENPPVEVTRAERIEKLKVVQAALIARDDAKEKTAIEAYFALNRPRPELEPALDQLVNAWTTFRNEPSLDTAESVIGWYDRMIPLENSLETELKTPFHTAVHKRLSGILVALEPKLEDADWKRISELCEKAEPKVESLQKYSALRILQMEAADDPKKKLDAADAAVVLISTTANPKSIPESRRSTLERIIKDAEPALGPKDTERKDKYAAGIKRIAENSGIPITPIPVIATETVRLEKLRAFIVLCKAKPRDTAAIEAAIGEYAKLNPPDGAWKNAPKNIDAAWKLLELTDITVEAILKRDGEVTKAKNELPQALQKDISEDYKVTLSHWLTAAAPKLDIFTRWSELALLCEKANPKCELLLAECLLEQGKAATVSTMEGSYSQFVNALRLKTSQPYDAADNACKALESDAKSKIPCLTARRKNHLKRMIKDARSTADKLAFDDSKIERMTTWRKTLKDCEGKEFDDKAQAEVDWLFAQEFLEKQPDDRKALPPLLALIRGTLEQKQLQLEDKQLLIFWQAYSAAMKDNPEELTAYEQLLDLFRENPGSFTADQIRSAFARPLNGIEKTSPELQSLYFKLGIYIRSVAAEWNRKNGEKDARELSFQCFERANAISRSARDAAWSGIVRYEIDGALPERQFKMIESRPAEEWTPPELILRGIVEFIPAKTLPDFAERVTACRKARATFLKARDKADVATNPEEHLLALQFGAENNILLANYSKLLDKPDWTAIRETLVEAESLAKSFLSLRKTNVEVIDTLGCVLEDQAWLQPSPPTATYDQQIALYKGAVSQFEKALMPFQNDNSPPIPGSFRAKANIHLGRCRCKWAELVASKSRNEAEGLLRLARTDLKSVAEFAWKTLSNEESGQVYYFLGKCESLLRLVSNLPREHQQAAIKYWLNGLESMTADRTSDWRTLMIADLYELLRTEIQRKRLTVSDITSNLKTFDQLLEKDQSPPSRHVRAYYRIAVMQLNEKYDGESALKIGVEGLETPETKCAFQDRWTQPELLRMIGIIYLDGKLPDTTDASSKAHEYLTNARKKAEECYKGNDRKTAPFRASLGYAKLKIGEKDTTLRNEFLVKGRELILEAMQSSPDRDESADWLSWLIVNYRYNYAVRLPEGTAQNVVYDTIIDNADGYVSSIALTTQMIDKMFAKIARAEEQSKNGVITSADFNRLKEATNAEIEKWKSDLVNWKDTYRKGMELALQIKDRDGIEQRQICWRIAIAVTALQTADPEAAKLKAEALKAYEKFDPKKAPTDLVKLIDGQVSYLRKQ